MNHIRTFRIDKLYYKFLKPNRIPEYRLEEFATLMHRRKFIIICKKNNELRYSETDRLTSNFFKDELFSLISTFL